MIYSGVDPAKRSRSVIVRHGRYTSRQFFLQIPFFPRADYNGGLVSRWGWAIARHGRLETLSVRRAIARRARQRHHWAVRQNLEECRGEGAGEWEAIEHFLFVRQNHQIHRTALKNRRVRSHKTRSLKKTNPVNSSIWNSNWILTSSVILFYWNVIHRHPDVLLLWSFSEWTQLLNVWTWIDATQFEVSVKKLLRIIGII